MVLFNKLKEATKDSPKRARLFYPENAAIRDALDALEDFLLRTDLERRVFHGPQKWFPQARAEFEVAWKEYDAKWRFRRVLPPPPPPEPVSEIPIILDLDFLKEGEDEEEWEARRSPPEVPPPSPNARPEYEYVEPLAPAGQREPEIADPESEEYFHPVRHDGGAALKLGIDYLYDVGYLYNHDGDLVDRNSCSIAYDAYDYLVKTIGINIPMVFSRWRRVPVVFMPAHVSNQYGSSEKDSLGRLLDDAVRAYVCGAPAAAIAMCRAVLETILKRHYGRGQWDDEKLYDLVVLASHKYPKIVQEGKIHKFRILANDILHERHQVDQLSSEDDRTILDFFRTLKFLIQRAPER